MADRGQGIRLFSSEEELRGVFEEWEGGDPETEEDEEDNSVEDEGDRAGVMTSQLRHFVAQRYIPPLLFPELGSRKFHIRTYVLAYGALKVYVYREMLALFAAEAYVEPGAGHDGSGEDMKGHLTNTCLQDGTREGSVLKFWDLPSTLASTAKSSTTDNEDWRMSAFESICACTSALFLAAAAQPTNFQPLPNAFEVFGVDWMVDADGKVWLLEVNAFPDFRQSGSEGRQVIEGLWKGVVGVIGGFWGDRKDLGERVVVGMVRVLDLDMGRA
jgi:tubulin--tyrosine ligase